ncbi:ABC transporter substrate-binding protein [Janthinobacterium fluminis]|uniref:PhnD/SsuA/transferrin family substrate-binding protein n=1 Tax=Janthinobacterium fluminis TaxID=2987524 RepID=A0ABT5JYV6_9BURK|nr:PhnD/SsuA/transferrin family substrate-binding protein [Janthinobacterium fluminis]MDC8757912.1 PhnD/SsuA/transferrin family substrate-binding protein [Janthinobacterium fluminis]
MGAVTRALLALALAAAAGMAQAGKLPKLVLAGPYAGVSFPLMHMVDSGALADLADRVEFVAWRDPDQLRVLALDGKADIVAMPSTVAANLYNRGSKLALLNVASWGTLWMVSRDAGLKTLADFKGKEVAMPFRADMPDIVFGVLAERQGLDVRKDFRLRYVASPLDAMQLLLTRRVDHVLLSEPAVSMALRKSRSFPLSAVAPDIHRSVDLQQEWGRLFKREARIPQAGIAALGKAKDDAALTARVLAAYAASEKWCAGHADACGALVAKYASVLSAEAVADAVRSAPGTAVTAQSARPELEAFYRVLLGKQPALLGGKLPDAAFYGGAAPPAQK